MHFTRIELKNWRNFKKVDIPLGLRSYLIGANASGKSNLLDVFRFLRTLAQSEGGGLQKALKERKGLKKLRSLYAREDPTVRIKVCLEDHKETLWTYTLAFRSEAKGANRTLVAEECVTRDGKVLLKRPNKGDEADPERKLQTHLEQTNNNKAFRELAKHFSDTTYLHLVPQLLKHSDEMGSRLVENDPFGQGLMQRIAKTPTRTRDARLKRIQNSLGQAIPQFSELRFIRDEITTHWHFEAKFNNWRPHGAWQREEQFSDGTLRLIGLLWALQESNGLLLLEEPELSLNSEIVRHIPRMVARVLRERGKHRSNCQVLMSTHSEELLAEVDGTDVLLIVPAEKDNGSTIRGPTPDELREMKYLTPAEVMSVQTYPKKLDKFGL